MITPKTVLLFAWLAAPGWHWLLGIGQRNAAVVQAQAAERRRHWAGAAAAWQAAAGSRPGPEMLLNLAHAQLKAGQTAAARRSYGQLLAPATPAAAGSVARQQLALLAATQRSFVPALGLLREALRLDPANPVARRNYERLQTYLSTQNTDSFAPPPPPPAGPKPDPTEKQRPKPAPASQPTADPAGPPAPRRAAPRPDRPNRPGSGPLGPVPTSPAGGNQRGLNAEPSSGPAAPGARNPRPGTDAATPADVQLQTQRQRLQALNMTPAQARQILETLRAQEQQYLQQVRRPAAAPGATDAKQPTW